MIVNAACPLRHQRARQSSDRGICFLAAGCFYGGPTTGEAGGFVAFPCRSVCRGNIATPLPDSGQEGAFYGKIRYSIAAGVGRPYGDGRHENKR